MITLIRTCSLHFCCHYASKNTSYRLAPARGVKGCLYSIFTNLQSASIASIRILKLISLNLDLLRKSFRTKHLPLLLFTTSKDIFIRIFSIAALFSYSNVSIAVYTRTTSLCNLASKIQGSRACSDAYEQTRRIFTLPSRKRLKEQPNQPLFLMLSISLKF